jgi:hypothetical protein
MRFLLLFFVGLFYFQALIAQVVFPGVPENPEEDLHLPESDSVFILDNLNVNQDSRLEYMLKWHIENNKKRDGISGYRVEIFNSSAFNAREQAFKKKKEFLSEFGNYNVHVKYASPIFRVRVGDFRTKNEALKLHKKIQAKYPGAFIVPDIIDFPVLKTEEI